MFILKILGGPLFGVEIALPQEDCFIRTVNIAKERIDDDDGVVTQEAFLKLPVAGSAPNLRLRQERDTAGNSVIWAEYYGDGVGVRTEQLALNRPVSFGAACIAVRHMDDVWSDEVAQAGLAPVPEVAGRRSVRQVGAFAVMACLLTLVLGGAGWWTVQRWSESPAKSVSAMLAEVPCQVIERDGRAYVLAEDAAALAWARKILAQRDAMRGVELRSKAADELAVERSLDQNGIPFFKVDMTNAEYPRVVLRAGAQPPSKVMLADVARRVATALPYVSQAFPVIRNEQDARQAAMDVASQLGVPVAGRDAGDRYVVELGGSLDDAQLDTLSRSLSQLQSIWGHRYVSFVVRQNDMADILGVKSGVEGYKLMAGRHVVFSSIPPNSPAILY